MGKLEGLTPALGATVLALAAMVAIGGCGGRLDGGGGQPVDGGGQRADGEGEKADGEDQQAAASMDAGGSQEGDSSSSGECAADGNCAGPSCGPMNAVGSLAAPSGVRSAVCPTVFGWAWTGAQCIAIVGCSCEGVDCPNLFGRKSLCLARYAACFGGD